MKPNGEIRFISLQGTIILVANVKSSEVDLTRINNEISECLLDLREKTWHLREVEDVRWISSENPDVEVSKFAKIVIKEYYGGFPR